MPSSSIVIQNLTLCAPDGRELLSHLDLTLPSERIGLVGRNGVGKSTLLAALAGEIAPKGGAITCRGRMARLRQAIGARSGETLADGLGLRQPLSLLARVLAGEAGEDEVEDADWTLETRVNEALSRFGLASAANALDRPMESFSGGERTRIGLAALVLAEPEIVLLDEPTNYLDATGRDAVAGFLAGWRGCAVVASHDRPLLRGLDRIVELSRGSAVSYGGGYDLYVAARQAADATAAAEFDRAEREVRAARRAAQGAYERQARRDAAGRSFRRSGSDGKLALDAAKGRAERTGARLSHLGERQSRVASERLNEARLGLERLDRPNFRIEGADVPAGRTVLAFEDVFFGRPGKVDILEGIDFLMVGAERVAVVGPNGAGKSTFLRLAAGEILPRRGVVRRNGQADLLDQHVALLDPRLSILDNLRRRDPAAGYNACRALLARFLFRADDGLTRVGSLSGGELLRAGLAVVCGASRPPDLLILDEPTNHLDIAATEAVEAALASFGGALLVVSHDIDFLEAIGIERRIRLPWHADGH